jgi:hypothetical protein
LLQSAQTFSFGNLSDAHSTQPGIAKTSKDLFWSERIRSGFFALVAPKFPILSEADLEQVEGLAARGAPLLALVL